MLLGDDVTITLGLDADRLKMQIIILTTLLTGVIVSISGTIGFVGLIGPSGCVKSTLLKNIYRVYKPSFGVVYIDGKDVSKLSSRETALEISVMQQENNVEFDMSVFDMAVRRTLFRVA